MLSDAYLWTGNPDYISTVVHYLQKFGGLDEDISFTYVYRSKALRIDNNVSAATAQPSDYFWVENEVLIAGTMEEYQTVRRADELRTEALQHVPIPEPLNGEITPPPGGSAGGGRGEEGDSIYRA